MTVNTTKITAGPYDGNDIADTFSYGFKVQDKTELLVYETDDAGVETVLTVDTDYTVNSVGDDGGGTITRTAGALPTNYEWFIRSNYDETQLTAFQSQGAFFPELHEQAMDKLTFLIQQILDTQSRTPVLSSSYSGPLGITLPDPESAFFIRWKSDFTGFENIYIDVEGLNQSITDANEAADRADNAIDGIEELAEQQRDQINSTYQSQFSYKRLGNISDVAGGTLTDVDKLNSYQYPDDSGEWYGPIQSQTFPITIPVDPSTDTGWAFISAATKRKALSLALNVPEENILFTAVGASIAANITHIYVSEQQASYRKPADVPDGAIIVSIVGDALETNVGNYTLETPEKSDLRMTVEQAQASTHIKLGDTVRLADRADGLFDVVDGETANGYNVIQLLTYQLKLRVKTKKLDSALLGVVADGIIDDIGALQSSINLAAILGINTVTFSGTPLIDSTIFMPAGMRLEGVGRGCEIIPSESGTFTGGYQIIINSTDGINADIEFPNLFAGGVSNFTFNNVAEVLGRYGVIGFGGCEFTDINGRYMNKIVTRPEGEYMDMVSVKRVFSEPVLGNEYQVDLRGLGDACIVEQVHCPWNEVNPGNGTPKSISISKAFGGSIRECIGGDIKVSNAKITIDGGHFEKGQILLDTAQVTINSSNISAADRVPIVIQNTGIHESTCTLNDVEFAYMSGLLEWSGAHVQLDSSSRLVVNNSYEKYSSSTDVEICQLSGIRIQNDSAALLQDWADYSYELSKVGRIERGFNVVRNFTISPTSTSFNGIVSIGTAPTEVWGGATDTYYYNIQLVLDEGRALGRNGVNGEQSVLLTNSGNGAQLIVDFGSRGASGFAKIYRGTSANSYTEVVTIPLFNARIFYDNGASINGHSWVSVSASDVDALNGIGEESLMVSGDHATVRAAAPPSVGAWGDGDRVDRITTVAGGNIGWTNTSVGFRAWGNIEA